MNKIKKSIEIGGRKLTLTTGLLAQQADAAVTARMGDTVVLATVVAKEPREDLGYFPLKVDYFEKLYAGGRIKGSRWNKRDGRPSDDEILVARLIDRSIRPLFPEDYLADVQVVVIVLSVDLDNDPAYLAPIAASAALTASNIPWNGPVGTVNLDIRDKKPVSFPLPSEDGTKELDLFVSSTDKAIIMIEAGANQIPEDVMVKSLDFSLKENSKLIKLINEFAKEVGNKKVSFEKSSENKSLKTKVEKFVKGKLENLIKAMSKKEPNADDNFFTLRNELAEHLGEDDEKEGLVIFDKLVKSIVRDMIFSGKRPDGRKHNDLRDLSAQVGILPRTHGTGLFQRGQTQALSVATLGSPTNGQIIETATGEYHKNYIHHYSMPPYSSGETGRIGGASRREIGHGALAERALLPVVPSVEEFPYTIRVATEIMSSNGSTSMASTCGSTLSLMDAGVPILAPVSGIAMGLVIKDEKNTAILTDIAGIEDHNGDMDFKVAGTEKGITALQLDVKTAKLTLPILDKALSQAKKARLDILKVMLKAIEKPREEVNKYAPKIEVLTIDKEKIGEVIGPGGKTIKAIIAGTGAQVDIDDEGIVSISGVEAESIAAAKAKVESLVKVPEPGELYEGEVKKILNFGAFVEILPGKEGMVHVSDMSEDFVKNPEDVLSVGDQVQVRVKEIDDMGRLNLSMILDPSKEKKRQPRKNNYGRHFKPQRGGSSGPHFTASRLASKDKKRY